MTAFWTMLISVFTLAFPFRNTITDMFKKEAQARLRQVPTVLVRLAVRRIDREWRDDFRDEWLGVLADMREATSDIPVTGFLRQARFALGVLIKARAVVREFTGEKRSGFLGSLLRKISLDGFRQRTTRSSGHGPITESPCVSTGRTVRLRWPVALAAVAALSSASTFFVMNLTQQGVEPQTQQASQPASQGSGAQQIPVVPPARKLDLQPLSFSVPVSAADLLGPGRTPAGASPLNDFIGDLRKRAPGRSVGLVTVFASRSNAKISQAAAAAYQVTGFLRAQYPQEFADAVGRGYWMGGDRGIEIQVYLYT